MISAAKTDPSYRAQLGHLDCLYPAGLPPVGSVEPLEVFVEEISGGPERDDEPANHHCDGSGEAHGLVEKNS